MKPFTIKASKPGIPTVDCTWHLEAETKEEAQAMFKVLMPGYEVSKVKSKKQEEQLNEPTDQPQATAL